MSLLTVGTPQSVALRTRKPDVPRKIANLAVWFDAADFSSISLDSSGNVSQWNDKSGNARHATQDTVLNRPGYYPNQLNGLGAVRGNGSSTFMTFSSPALDAGYTLFIVYNTGAVGTQAIYGQFPSAASGNGVTIGSSRFRTGLNGFATVFPSGIPSSTDIAIVFRYDGSHPTGNFLFKASYSAIQTQPTITQDDGTPPSGTASLLSYVAGVNNNSAFNLYEFAIYNRQITNTERDQLQSYVTSKWGITWA